MVTQVVSVSDLCTLEDGQQKKDIESLDKDMKNQYLFHFFYSNSEIINSSKWPDILFYSSEQLIWFSVMLHLSKILSDVSFFLQRNKKTQTSKLLRYSNNTKL